MFLFQKQIKNQILRVFLYVNCFFCLSFILLSGSRTGLIETLAIVFLAGFTLVNQYLLKKGKSVSLSILMSVVINAMITGIVFLVLNLLKNGLTLIPDFVESLKIKAGNNNMEIQGNQKPVKLTRNDVSDSNDLSNGRFGICWSVT